MSSSVHVDNNGTDILNLGEGTTQGLDDTILTAEAKYTINFTQVGKEFILSLQVYQLKTKHSEIKDYAPCLGNISKNFLINQMKKTELKGVLIFLCVEFNPIDTNNILDIHKYLMKRT